MDKKDKIERVLYYHLEKEIIDNKENYSFGRAEMYKENGQQGEKYYNGKWHSF